MVNFTGMFIYLEPGFAGRLVNRTAYQISILPGHLQSYDVSLRQSPCTL